MSERAIDIETMLRQALAPVEPPAELQVRLETTLGSLVELAADELESWELSTLSDPKNWARLGRPAAAAVVGSAAAVGLSCSARAASATAGAPSPATSPSSPSARLRDGGREARQLLDDLH